MDNLININNTKENVLEFELLIEGANSSEAECHFVITADGMDLRFPAILEDAAKNLWSVKIPALDFVDRTTYNCYTEVVTEGQYFKPMKGNVNIVGSAQIYTSTPKNKTVESDIKQQKINEKADKKRDEKRKNESWRSREKSIEQIATELMEKEKFSKEKIEEKVEQKKTVDKSKDEKERAILEESGIKPKKKKKERVSFVKTQLIN